MKKIQKDTIFFLAPSLILVVVFLIYPMVQSIILSLSDGTGEFVGLVNYLSILKDPRVINWKNIPGSAPYGAMINNLIWILVHLPITLFSGLLLAIMLQKVSGGGIIQSIIFMGMVVPMVIAGILVRFLFSKNAGLVSNIMGLFGIDSLAGTWTAHPGTALPALILVSIWLWTGYTLVVYLAALTGIPSSYYEAAQIDGATPVQAFLKITLPLLKPATGVIIIMTVIWELKLFDIVYASTGGGPGNSTNVLALEMYLTTFKFGEQNRGAAIATLLTLLSVIPIYYSVKDGIGSNK
jgi:multiple sugar transport system permease protein